MKLYSYWDNKKGWHAELIFQCQAASILDADQQLKAALNLDPVKVMTVSCSSQSLP
jgi:hypothetical protein